MKNLSIELLLAYRKQSAGTLDFPFPVIITPCPDSLFHQRRMYQHCNSKQAGILEHILLNRVNVKALRWRPRRVAYEFISKQQQEVAVKETGW